MDLDTTATQMPATGAWSRRRRLTLGLTAVALVAGGGVAIAAGQPDTDTTDDPTATATAKAVPGKALFGFGGVLHSESVVSDGNGGYVTHLTQIGKVESVDSDNLTVVSEDGYKRSWARTADTVVGGGGWSVTKNDDGSYTVKKAAEELAAGDQVMVVGTLKDDQATAQRIASQPEAGEIPGMILKRLDGEFGGKTGAPSLKDRMLQRFEGGGGDVTMVPGPMGGPGGEVRKFEFRTGPDGEAGTRVMPAPGAPGEAYGYGEAVPAPAAPAAPSSGATPAEPSAATSSGSVSLT